jgi:hypothetical protein
MAGQRLPLGLQGVQRILHRIVVVQVVGRGDRRAQRCVECFGHGRKADGAQFAEQGPAAEQSWGQGDELAPVGGLLLRCSRVGWRASIHCHTS